MESAYRLLVLPILVPYQSTEQQMLLSRLSMLPPLAIFFEWLPFRFPFSLAWLTSCLIAALSSSSSRWWSPAAACGVLRRRGTHRTAFEVFCPCDSASRQLGQLPRGGTPVQPRALSPANLRIDSPPSRSAFQTVPGHPEADEAGCCVDIAGLGETGVDGQFQLRRGGRSPVQPCTPSPANVQTHYPPSRSTHQSIPGH